MDYWWDGLAKERFWCEITDRKDVGSDLKCPQLGENDRPFWSYSFIKEISKGDVVFHYSTRSRAFIGASTAAGALQERPIVWKPHGGRRDTSEPANERPGWFLPLSNFRASTGLLTLEYLRQNDDEWIRNWIAERNGLATRVYAPFQRNSHGLRAAQGYLTKMPSDFVERWSNLAALVGSPLVRSSMAESQYPFQPANNIVRLKAETDYIAVISPSVQIRSRAHERLVRIASEQLEGFGARLTTQHPIDLKMVEPVSVLFEAKIVTSAGAVFAVRSAVGQLYEYSHFLGPQNALLCILLDVDPGDVLVKYIEERLDLFVLWIVDDKLGGGPRSMEKIVSPCLRLPAAN